MGIDRFFEYTHDAFKARFDSMSDEVVSELMSLPTLFAYERGVQEPARVGRITRIQRGYKDITITFSIDPSIPPKCLKGWLSFMTWLASVLDLLR